MKGTCFAIADLAVVSGQFATSISGLAKMQFAPFRRALEKGVAV